MAYPRVTPQRKISVYSPHMPQSVIDVAVQTLKSKWLNVGAQTTLFEKAFADKFNLKYAVALNSCTSALRLAYALAGVGPGDEVITSPFTMVATNTAILEQYATPVFADVEYETGNTAVSDVEHRITNKTKAIVCIHNLGYPCDLDELREIARAHNLALIEDCAHAIGASYKGHPIGNDSEFACFSFATVKHITTGDGGMLTTNNQAIFEEANRCSWFGMDRKKRDPLTGIYPEDIEKVGYKMRMNGFLAAIGTEQLRYLDGILVARKEKARIYNECLEGIKGVTLMEYNSQRESSYFIYPIHVERREKFAQAMHTKGIEVLVQNSRNDRFSVFGKQRNDLPNTDRIDRDFICLPIHEDLSPEDVQYIIKSVKEGW
jgi:perosamine synthetase